VEQDYLKEKRAVEIGSRPTIDRRCRKRKEGYNRSGGKDKTMDGLG